MTAQSIKNYPVITSEGGDITVGRKNKIFVYGRYLQYAEDGSQHKPDERRTEGFVAKATDDDYGRFDFQFVRDDIAENLEDNTSNFEKVIDDAIERNKGKHFFERDITPAGLGALVPGLDFDLGDMVNVRLWGKLLPVPVTAIDYIATDDEGPASWRVHVGGQILNDARQIRAQNEELLRLIEAEKKARAEEVEKARLKAVEAEKVALEAKYKATEAETSAGEAKTTANTANANATQAKTTATNANNTAAEALVQAGLVKDSQKLTDTKSSNAEAKAIAAEATAQAAKTEAASAKTTSLSAKKSADDVVASLDSVSAELLKQGLQGSLAAQLAEASKSGLQSQAWVNTNQAAWNLLQQQWNSKTDGWIAQQNKFNQLNTAFMNEQTRINTLSAEWMTQQEAFNDMLLLNDRMQTLLLNSLLEQQKKINAIPKNLTYFVPGGVNRTVEDDYIQATVGINGSLKAKGSWIGKYHIVGYQQEKPVLTSGTIQPGSREASLPNMDRMLLNLVVTPAVQKSKYYAMTTSFTPPRNDWTEGFRCIIPTPLLKQYVGGLVFEVKVTWRAANYTASYGLDLKDPRGNTLAYHSQAGLGPLIGTGARTQRLVATTDEFETWVGVNVRSTSSSASSRVVEKIEVTAYWSEEA